jgi:hypothetical protein
MAESTRNSAYPNFADDYNKAAREFKDLRKLYTRKAFDGREFVLVERITQHLENRASDTNYGSNRFEQLLISGHHRYDPQLPKVLVEDLKSHLAVFYILIDLGCPEYLFLFREQGLSDEKLPVDLGQLKTKIKNAEVPNFDKFLEDFFQRQFVWCPMTFNFDMGKYHNNQTVPLYNKKRLNVHRDGFQPLGSHSKLWHVEIPADFVSHMLQSKMKDAKFRKTLGTGESQTHEEVSESVYRPAWTLIRCPQCYHFTLKEFEKSKKKFFDQEKTMTRALKKADGILQYLGWYQCVNPDGQEFFNIILESGQSDFYTTIRQYSPPDIP